MIPNKETQSVEKKFFALLIETETNSFLSVQYAYSLEEAVAYAKTEFFTSISSGVPASAVGVKIGLFAVKTFSQLENPKKFLQEMIAHRPPAPKNPPPPKTIPMVPAIKLPSPTDKKNLLMQKIIKDGDKKSYKKNLKLFSKEERKYLRERLP